MRYVRANDDTTRGPIEKMVEGLPPSTTHCAGNGVNVTNSSGWKIWKHLTVGQLKTLFVLPPVSPA